MSTRRFILVVVIVTFAVAVFGPILRGFGTTRDRAGDDKAAPPPNAATSFFPAESTLGLTSKN
jgi:hypothetical protein